MIRFWGLSGVMSSSHHRHYKNSTLNLNSVWRFGERGTAGPVAPSDEFNSTNAGDTAWWMWMEAGHPGASRDLWGIVSERSSERACLLERSLGSLWAVWGQLWSLRRPSWCRPGTLWGDVWASMGSPAAEPVLDRFSFEDGFSLLKNMFPFRTGFLFLKICFC